MKMKETSTVIIKLTRQEIEVIINTLNFILTTNLPIDADFLKPYHNLKTDLIRIRRDLIDGEQQQ